MKKRWLILILLIANSLMSYAPVSTPDTNPVKTYPVSYFRNPLNIPIQLAANFGELRTNHFHMGFDIRTNQRENLPVFAAADGYISRIKIERFGFGRAIYIDHPNGYTTLYAHLNDFYPALQEYITNKQYANEQWEQEITFEPGQFAVSKGQFIAYSGNTGGSQGPHLHFEIRDTETGNNLNPWLFNFGLADNTPPFIYRLYYYDRRYSTYQANPVGIPIIGAGGRYSAKNTVTSLPSPYVSFGIAAEDKTSASSFRFGIFEAEIMVDSTIISGFRLDNISYNDTRYLNGSIDYKTKLSGGGYIQHLSRLPGNYSTTFFKTGNGAILLNDTSIHTAQITVRDAAGNASYLNYKFRWDPLLTKDLKMPENTVAMVPEKQNVFKADGITATFSPKAFYDTVPFLHKAETVSDTRVVSAVHYLHNYKVPVHDSFTVRIRPSVVLPDSLKDRVVMQLVTNKDVEAAKGQWVHDELEAKFRDLGIFKLIVDTMPATVRTAGWVNGSNLKNRNSFALLVTDNAGEIKSFKALLDGQWLLFSRKKDLFIHTFDSRTTAGTHELQIFVEDIAGNRSERTFRFLR